MRSGAVLMNAFTKFSTAMKRWGWGRAAFLLALFLLVKQFVTFDQALVPILLAALLENVVRRKSLSPRHHSAGTSITLRNDRRR
jgi:hypothetical protein